MGAPSNDVPAAMNAMLLQAEATAKLVAQMAMIEYACGRITYQQRVACVAHWFGARSARLRYEDCTHIVEPYDSSNVVEIVTALNGFTRPARAQVREPTL